MNLFLCLFLMFNQMSGLEFKVNNNELNYALDKIDLVRYYGRTQNDKAKVEIHISASCNTCRTSYKSAISLKDENNEILATFLYGEAFVGNSVAVMYIEDEVINNNDIINITATVTFPQNSVQQDQIQKIKLSLENVGESVFDVDTKLLSYRKKCPYFMEVQRDGSQIKLYELYAFNKAISGDFKLNEIDIEQLSFQYSDSSLNEIPIYFGEAYLLIDDIFKESDITLRDGSYYFPLDINCEEYTCKFSLLKNYYYDYDLDMLFETYLSSRVATNNLKLPSSYDTNKKIPYKIVLEDVGAYSDEIIINGEFKVSYKLFGACDNSKYCVGNSDGVKGDVEYEQTLEISS